MAAVDSTSSFRDGNIATLQSPEIILSGEDDPKLNESPEKEDTLPKLKQSPQNENNGILNVSTKAKGLPRRVSFPDGDKIISGYGEPRNPWAQAKTTSTEELIQAYTQSCQHWGVKPITKLLVQLQEIKDFSVRANSLTLKGEKLDTKVVETLEAVFKRVQFVIMDLEATNLDDDSAAALFDMIEYYESAVNVLVGFNKNLGTRGWQAAAHMMRKMSCLRLFDGHSVPLTEQAVPFVGRALRLSNTLVTLHLENASLSGRPMLLIVSALRMNVTLRELFLADNRLISTDALQIANLLKFNIILQLLDIRNNLIQDAGLCHMCSGLMSQPQHGSGGLQTLVLWNNQLSYQSMGKLAMALRNTSSLSTLNLGQNVLGDDGASRLKEGLLQNHSLLRLGLVGTKLTCEGAIALAEFLAESPRIIRLDLRNNNIRVGGLMALSLAFKINYSLLRLDIDKPNGKETLKELMEKQESLLSDIVVYANRNKEQAYRRVMSAQLERQRKYEEEKQRGLRYMDMTHSIRPIHVTPATSYNNSNNKLGATSSSNDEQQANGTVLKDVDDSPINSPEFLPANSVSYHQISPVMFSSSEIEKRAAQAVHEATLQEQKASDAEETPENESTAEAACSNVNGLGQTEGDIPPLAAHESQGCDDSKEEIAQSTTVKGVSVAAYDSSQSVDSATKTPTTGVFDDAAPTESPEGGAETLDQASSSEESTSPDLSTNAETPSVVSSETAESDPDLSAHSVPDATEVCDVTVSADDDAPSAENGASGATAENTDNVTISHFDLSLFPH